jgi:two-component system, OmpR family, sensor histidine kinase VicK
VDKALSFTVELNDDDDSNETSEEEAIGLATYSNSESTVLVYASVFENFWIQAETSKNNQQYSG